MILDENFAILDEDEDIEDLEDVENEDEVMDEGYIFDEDYDILNEALITSASAVDTSKSAKAIESVKKDFAKKISSGKYRNYKSSDKELLEKAINSKELKKRAASEIAGAAIGSVVGATAGSFAEKFGRKGVSAIKNRKSNDNGKTVEESVDMNEVLDEAIEFYMENVVGYLLDEEYDVFDEDYEILDEVKKPNPSLAIRDYANKRNVVNYNKKAKKISDPKNGYDTDTYKAKTKKNKEKFDKRDSMINNSYKTYNSAKKATGSHISNNKVGTGVGAGVGALSGAMLAKKLMSSMKYSVFTLNGLTILSLYATNKEGQAKNKSVCYAILTKSDDSKVLMQKINLKGIK